MKGKKKGKLHKFKHVTKKEKHSRPGVTGYISRTQVTKKLQLNIKEFRQLCIFKGVHPVEPGLKRIRKDASKTWYYLKDINFMNRDEIVNWFRARSTYKKKVAHLKGLGRKTELLALKQRKPKLNMDHFVRERYPTLQDAVNDMDDAISLLCLFVEMQHGVAAKYLKKKQFDECLRLKCEWMAYVTETRALRKVFVSIKGIYYQADVLGSVITWLVPHPQRIKVPASVDVLTMCFFTDFYITMLNFILYRLYTDLGLQYPPKLDYKLLGEEQTVKAVQIEKIEHKAPVLKNETPAVPSKPSALTTAEKERIAIVRNRLSHIISVDADMGEEEKKLAEVEVKEEPKDEAEGEIPDEFRKIDEAAGENKEQYKRKTELFTGFKIFINREIPKQELRFMIRAFGGEDFSELECEESDPKITHQIVDRDLDKRRMLPNREYVQPQWLFDSINAGILLPYHEYAHDATLPPHISPFINDELKGYVPRQREHLNELIEQQKGGKKEKKKPKKEGEEGEDEASEDDEEGGAKYVGEYAEADDPSTIEAQYARELAAEREGKSYAGYVQDELGETELYPDADSDSDVDTALKKKPKTKQELVEEHQKHDAQERERMQIDLLNRKTRRKVLSIKGRLERSKASNEALEEKRRTLEKKQRKEARAAHKALPTDTASSSTSSSSTSSSSTSSSKRKDSKNIVDDKPAKKVKKNK